jgi:hypothetical protein
MLLTVDRRLESCLPVENEIGWEKTTFNVSKRDCQGRVYDTGSNIECMRGTVRNACRMHAEPARNDDSAMGVGEGFFYCLIMDAVQS